MLFNNEAFKRNVSVATLGLMLSVSLPLAAYAESSSYSSTTTTRVTTTQQVRQIPAGTNLSVRTVGVLPVQKNGLYTGELIAPVVINGNTVIPAQSRIEGTVVSVDPSSNTEKIQFTAVTLPNGDRLPIDASLNVPLNGTATAYYAAGDHYPRYLPRVSWGRDTSMTGGQKLAVSTVGGAALGAATGTLAGVIMPAVYRNDIGFSEGTGAVRGLAWGSAIGAGLGLTTGLIAAAADRKSYNTTSVGAVDPVSYRPGDGVTNLTTGSVEYPASNAYSANTDMVVVLQQPVNLGY